MRAILNVPHACAREVKVALRVGGIGQWPTARFQQGLSTVPQGGPQGCLKGAEPISAGIEQARERVLGAVGAPARGRPEFLESIKRSRDPGGTCRHRHAGMQVNAHLWPTSRARARRCDAYAC